MRKKRSKDKSDRSKKRLKRSTKMYCPLHGENTSHTTKECNTLKAKGKGKPKFYKKDFKKNSREFNLIEKKASLEKEKYLKYKIFNKASKKKTLVILELYESDSSSSEEEDSSSEESLSESSRMIGDFFLDALLRLLYLRHFASINAVSKLFELSLCSLMSDLLLFK